MQDGETGFAGDVVDDFGEFDIHEFKGFLHVLDATAAVANESAGEAQVTPQLTDAIVRTESGLQKSTGVKAANPLAIEPVAFGPPRAMGLTRVDKDSLEAARGKDLEDRNPVNTGRFQGNRGYAAFDEPVDQ